MDTSIVVQTGPTKKRFWYLVDATGARVENDGKLPKIHGKNPFQAVQKAITRYATEPSKEYEFHLREARGKPTKAGKLRVYKYKGWKTPLTETEQSEFTKRWSISSKPHAKSLGKFLVDAEPLKRRRTRTKNTESPAKEAVPKETAPKKVKETAPKKVKETAPKKAKEASPKEAAPKRPRTPKEAAPKEAGPNESATKKPRTQKKAEPKEAATQKK